MKSDIIPVHLRVADEIAKHPENGGKYVVLPFYFDGKPLEKKDAPSWGMSLKTAGSMRFRWNEQNQNRIEFLATLCRKEHCAPSAALRVVPLELVHSKDVFVLETGNETFEKKGDGMITQNRTLLPAVTVADCMPVFIFDKKTGVFGALHSGWKGTGIAAGALEAAQKKFGTRAEDVCAVLGPHIQSCCYIVDEDRASYFETNFCADCVAPVSKNELTGCAAPDWNIEGKKLFRLSLAKANLSILKKCGVRPENTVVCTDCTCCTKPPLFGSFRRETAFLPKTLPVQERWNYFTVQAAFCGYL